MAVRKWGGLPHWEMPADLLGTDDLGTWLGTGPGHTMIRPGGAVSFAYRTVTVVAPNRPYVAFFFERAPTAEFAVYVDVTTEPRCDGSAINVVDLDLDVVRDWDGAVRVLDRDEFARHRLALGYPEEIVDLARRTCREVQAMLRSPREPFGGAGARWLARYVSGDLAA